MNAFDYYFCIMSVTLSPLCAQKRNCLALKDCSVRANKLIFFLFSLGRKFTDMTQWSNAVKHHITNLGFTGSNPAQVNDFTRLVVSL